MASNPITPNMTLALPVPGVTPGLGIAPPGQSWLELLCSALSRIDGHSHAPGFGAPVPASALNINADLPFNGQNAIGLRTARLNDQGATLAAPTDIGCLYRVGADLYYNDAAGNVVRITSGGALAGTPGSISGLVSPAAVAYTPAQKLFAFTSSSGYPANLSIGALSVGDNSVSGGNAVGISAPSGLSAPYGITLPVGLPASTLPLSIGPTGQLSAAQITSSQIANGAVGATQIASASITNAQQGFGTPSASSDVVIKSYVDAIPRYVVAGSCPSLGVIASQTGTVTATSVRNSTGNVTVSVPGLTNSAIVLVSSLGAASTLCIANVTTGSFTAYTYQTSTGSLVDGGFCFMVIKL